ncbi:MGMT family protein [Kosmotoga sp.]|uniref:MGMT family protein n=1 Tax=Kosmotoga sp. TaxID=1955248 RepID=UPI0024ABFDE4|nr:MGMT family protein [Kosmotoga sp.]MDI3524182.1 methylated-DNA-protein-cysteine methyltransferase related protein [Kosmotoga sp.]
MKRQKESLYEKIYNVVRKIPFGKVASYGQIAVIVGCSPRMVGFALASLKSGNVPWHRVVNSKGKISLRDSEWRIIQRQVLEAEGVKFNEKGKINFSEFGWNGTESSD